MELREAATGLSEAREAAGAIAEQRKARPRAKRAGKPQICIQIIFIIVNILGGLE